MRRLLVQVILLSGAVLTACQRPVHTIRESADFSFDHGDYDTAATEYAEIADRYPGDWRAQYRLGLCLLEIDELARARDALEVAHSHRPRDPGIANALAEAMYQQGDESRLFAFLRQRARSMQSPAAYLLLARYALEMGDPDSAQVALETAIVLDDGQTVDPYLAAASFAERLGDLETALRRLRQAYSIDQADARVIQRLKDLGEIPGPTIALPPGH